MIRRSINLSLFTSLFLLHFCTYAYFVPLVNRLYNGYYVCLVYGAACRLAITFTEHREMHRNIEVRDWAYVLTSLPEGRAVRLGGHSRGSRLLSKQAPGWSASALSACCQIAYWAALPLVLLFSLAMSVPSMDGFRTQVNDLLISKLSFFGKLTGREPANLFDLRLSTSKPLEG